MVQKVFMTKSGKANFSCPECGKNRQMDVARYVREDKEVKLKCTCTCTHVFSVILERRKHIRKKIELPGVLIFRNQRYAVNVIDISRMGLKIRTKEILDLHLEEKVVVAFTLDNANGSKVSKEVIVRKVNQTNVSVEFLSHDHYDKLGPYLLFRFE